MAVSFLLAWAMFMALLNAWNFLFGIKNISRDRFKTYRNDILLIGLILNSVLTIIAGDPIRIYFNGYGLFQYISFLWLSLLIPIVVKFLSDERERDNNDKKKQGDKKVQ